MIDGPLFIGIAIIALGLIALQYFLLAFTVALLGLTILLLLRLGRQLSTAHSPRRPHQDDQRIGEILALRWKRVDLLRGTIEVAETFSDGEFGSPKTRSSNRMIPMSSALRSALETHRAGTVRTAPDDLLFHTPKGTPLSSKNLYNRVLAPACDRIKQPRVSWHSFRHTHATLLAEVGESLKTAQALLGHSDLETTLNTYMHVIPDSQRRAVDRVAGVLFSDVLNSGSSREDERVN